MVIKHKTAKIVLLIKLIRPKQWLKNSFVYAALIFSGTFLDVSSIYITTVTAVMFCLASSVTYIFNDILDRERDRLHPIKSKTRPIAAGSISVFSALTLLGAMFQCVMIGWFILPVTTMSVILSYLGLNLLYSTVLKHQPVIDIFVVAIGFVLRIYAGAMAINVTVSSWMFITTLCLALYLASIKRRQELAQQGTESRMVLKKYSVTLVERYAEMSATGALLFYSMFVMSVKPELVLSIPLVLYGMFRYWYIVDIQKDGESPTDTLLSDWQILLIISLWVAVCIYSLWPQ